MGNLSHGIAGAIQGERLAVTGQHKRTVLGVLDKQRLEMVEWGHVHTEFSEFME